MLWLAVKSIMAKIDISRFKKERLFTRKVIKGTQLNLNP